MLSRPADKRTRDLGIMMRATAMVRTNSSGSKSSIFSNGVPATFTNMLIGTESGCWAKLANCCNKPARSVAFSPMPTIPPEQTFMPEERTFVSVSKRL